MKVVIRAGGIGTRLWPMSRMRNPKQFQKIVDDKTMVRTTFERVAPALVEPKDVFMSVHASLKERACQELPEINRQNIIAEPDTRNTGPAMCLEVCYLEKFCKAEEVIASITSDDYISDVGAFAALLSMAEEFVQQNPDYIVTPGVKPDYPDTGYSYLKAGKNLQELGEEAIYEVDDIVEKPNEDYCKELIASGRYYYHTGMYIWQLGTISALFRKHQPAMFETCVKIVDIIADSKTGDKKGGEAAELYSQLEKISIESAITDKVDRIAMSVSNRIGWSDLGKWHVIKRVLEEEPGSNLIKGDVFVSEASNNLVYSLGDKKITVINNVNNLAIVDTGDVLFISSLEHSADIKEILEQLKEKGLDKYL